jgi:hypothetical protein
MKTYVLTISKVFPKTHKRAGEPTNFNTKINRREKLHTIRANYDLWKKRIDEVNAGTAMLSVREWSGKPYQTKQVELFQFTAENWIGIQKLENPHTRVGAIIDDQLNSWADVANNDGLSFEDFCDWFKSAKNEPMAVIHFTEFRY